MENDFTWFDRAEVVPMALHGVEEPPATPPGYAARPHPSGDLNVWRIVQLAEVPIVDVLEVNGTFTTLDGSASTDDLSDLIEGVALFMIEGGAQ